MRDMQLSIKTMNAGTADEFDRVFIHCRMGHDMGSLSVENLTLHPFEFDPCNHYEHQGEV